MVALFLDGFDKYGPANSNATNVAALMAGEWTTVTNVNLVGPLSATGQAIAVTSGGALTCTKTLASAVGRIIGGFRFSAGLNANVGLQFLDGASNQCGIGIATTGVISLRNGSYTAGTILGSSSAISAGTTHYLEFDITFGNANAYNVYLDGVSVISGTGDTTATANNTISGVSFVSASGGANALVIDDLYLFDSTGSTNNAALLTSPRIETTFPSSDVSAAFSIGASIVGPSTTSRTTGLTTSAANQFRVRPITPTRSCTLNSISMMPGATSSTINLRPVVYSDSSGAPSSLLSSGSTVTGITSGAAVTMPLTTTQSLSAGVQYWIGYMCDIAVTSAAQNLDTGNLDRTGTATFSSGAPSSPPTLSSVTSTVIWGNVSGVGVNSYQLTNPPQGAYSYVTATGVGVEDLYSYPFLSTTPQTVHTVALKANVSRSDSGARTVSMRMKSGSADSGGSSTGQTPSTSYAWLATFFPADPNTSAAWLPANLNAATSGVQIDS